MKFQSAILAALLPAIAACTAKSTLPEPEPGDILVSTRLSNQRVNSFTEDADGRIWMATSRGLNEYNVHEYHQYFCTNDTFGLPDNQINKVYCDRSGRLWAATVNGIAYRGPDGVFRRITVPDSNRNISDILESRGGTLLFSNADKLFYFDPEKNELRLAIRDLNAFGSPAVVPDDSDRLWVNTGTAVNVYDAKDFSLSSSTPVPFLCYHICHVGNGELWLSGMGDLRILDMETLHWKELPEAVRRTPGLMQGDIDIIYSVDDNRILLNVIGKGMYCYFRTREKVLFQEQDGFPFELPEGEIRTIFRDTRDNLWFGTSDQGYTVSYQDSQQFNSNKFLTEAFAGKSVTALETDKAGNLWISTLRDGLFCYHLASRQLKQIDLGPLIPDQSIGFVRSSNVFCDSEGELWLILGDKYRILRCSYDGKHLKVLDSFNLFYPISIAEDEQGGIWLGGLGNTLLRYDKHSRESVTVKLPGETDWAMVTDLLPEAPGILLAGGLNVPLSRVNSYTLETEPHAFNQEERTRHLHRSIFIPNQLFEDSAGDLWIATVANGVLRIRGGLGGSLETIPGAPCMDIASIIEDRQGNIWVSTMSGLGKYDRVAGKFTNYFLEDGIGGDQFSERASCILPDGTLVFGGTHGLTWFHPRDVDVKKQTRLVFEDLKIHNKLVRPSADGPIDKLLRYAPDITIQNRENAFSISFSALDYDAYERTRYVYKMEGFDQDWVEAGTRNEAYYANLPSGKYRFVVGIAGRDRTVEEKALNIRILPPWYASWWAICLWCLLGLLFVGISYTYYRHILHVRREAAERISRVRHEKKKAEEARQAEQELNRIQMNYFANVAHEFRTPLTMISGPAQQLAASPAVHGQERQLVDIIRRNATWMLSLVNQLLDFNRIGNSKLQMKAAKIDIIEPLADTVRLFAFNAESKRIDLRTVGLEDSFTMWADADKVQKIVMNLLSNALKYTPSGGHVMLAFDVISREEAASGFPLTENDRDGLWACISVSDTGPGISEAELEKIFERFYLGKSSSGSGTGIGLFYARALCHLHHGYIRAWNRSEGGAQFRVILPVSATSYTEDERTAEAPELHLHSLLDHPQGGVTPDDGAKKRVAIVDDDIDIANYLKILLNPQYRVSMYFDGASALKGMEEETPDLVISDVMMPGMSGYELCESVKGNLQLSHIPVVLVTAKVAVENQVQGLGKGADAYVTKPFQPAYLLALVKSLLENREKLRQQLGSVTTTDEIAPEAMSPRDAAFMKELYELMEKELSNAGLDIRQMGEMMKISRTKFYYKVKALTGEPPSIFFKRYKLNRAADLLKEGKYNISEIAWKTGFNTLSHFSSSFKEQFGVTPSDYLR